MGKSNGKQEVENLDVEHELPAAETDDASVGAKAQSADVSAGDSELQRIKAERDTLLDRLARHIQRTEYRDESKPWQDEPMVWWLLGVLLGLLTLEWAWRKWLDLP